MPEPDLARVIRAGYKLLDLITFFTAGPGGGAGLDRPSRRQGGRGRRRRSATDFERGFIRGLDDLMRGRYRLQRRAGGEGKGPDARQEGKDYVVKDGDIFQFNV